MKRKFKFNIKKFLKNMGLVILFIILISIFANKIYAYKTPNYKKITVSNGDTLWSIANEEQKNNEYYKNKDIREIVYDIKKINNLQNNLLKVGQQLDIETFN